MQKLILSLCDYSGNWCKPYKDAGYFVHQVDLKINGDVRLQEYYDYDNYDFLAALP